MAEINFSSQDTGACPYCIHQDNCTIQREIIESLNNIIYDTYDDEMEIVIYRCPEFRLSASDDNIDYD